MFIVYQIIISIGLIITSPYLLIRAIFGRHGVKERLGWWNIQPDDRKIIWFHAASMGEIKIVSTVLPEILNCLPDSRVIITTVTKTGKATANKLPFPVETFYLPIDLKFIVKRVVKKVKPSLLVLVETELWPALIDQAHKNGAKIALVNGRISNRSFKLYELVLSITAATLKKVDYIMTQTESDSGKFTKLGAPFSTTEVFGNTKFDQVLISDQKPPSTELKQYLDAENNFIFIAGSVRQGEIQILVDVSKTLLSRLKNIKIIIALRHLKDMKKLLKTIECESIKYIARTKLSPDSIDNCRLMILDTMGELGGLYQFADLAFVGGSLVKIGGHDPLEPASVGCAVCFGKHMDNSRIFAEILVNSGGAVYVENTTELAELIEELAVDRSKAKSMGEKARQAVVSHTGVSKKIASKLTELIRCQSFSE